MILKNRLITVNRILNEDWFTFWELEGVILDSAQQWHLNFEYVGDLRGTNESVYVCHNSEIRQELLLSWKRRGLWKKFIAGDVQNNKI